MALFGWSRRGERQDALDNVIGPTTSLRGHIKSDGGARIDGRFEGRIEVAGNVVVTEGGSVVGDIFARDVTIGGTVEGNIEGAGRLEILPTGKLFGDVTAAAILIDDGGVFEGISRMRGAARPALPPPEDAMPALADVVIELGRRPATTDAMTVDAKVVTSRSAADPVEPTPAAGSSTAVPPSASTEKATDGRKGRDAVAAAAASAAAAAAALGSKPTSTEDDPPAPRVSKAAARLIAENGLDVAEIEGTGHRGMITKADVRRVLSEQRKARSTARSATAPPTDEPSAPSTPPAESAKPTSDTDAEEDAAEDGGSDVDAPDSALDNILDLSALHIEPVIPDADARVSAPRSQEEGAPSTAGGAARRTKTQRNPRRRKSNR